MDTAITRAEHEEFCRRMEDEHHRLNKRMELLENNVKQIGDLNVSVANLASSMNGMLEEQKKQGERLEVIESRDGEMWRKVTGYVITAVIGIIVGFIFTRLGL